MLIDFFFHLRDRRVKTSVKEFLDLLQALKAGVIVGSVNDFYSLCRIVLIKDESEFDRFDRAFAEYYDGLSDLSLDELAPAEIPEDWLRKVTEKFLSEEEKQQIEALGGFDKLMQTLTERLKEQHERHQGGNKWIGTGGTSPFGAYGYNPEGIRIGQHESRHRRAVKVWDKREFKNLDGDRELGTRNIKLALKKLREFVRQGQATELDLAQTIKSTADKGGMLDIKLQAERHNQVKVLLFFDVGGSMDDHIKTSEELFSAARTEFKHMEYFYFHNCVYEAVWRDNGRRRDEKISTWDVLNKYGSDYKLIFVGDASMSPYEIVYPGGAVEYWNEEAGAVWMQRLTEHFPQHVWLNPVKPEHWGYTESIDILQKLVRQQMYPLTLDGLQQAMRALL